MPGGRVLVVGSVNVDLVVAASRLPVPGQTVTGGDVARYPGGKGGNQATAAARLGARVAFIGAVGRTTRAAKPGQRSRPRASIWKASSRPPGRRGSP